MTNNLKTLLDEVKNIIQELKTNSSLTGQAKTDLEKRIQHIYDKSNPRHTNLTQDLPTDLKELIEIEQAIGQERIEQTKKQQELENKNKKLETDNQNKDQQIKEKDEEIGQKITKEFIQKLEKLEPGKLDETKITELKTALTELKDQGVKADLTETEQKIAEVGKKIEQTKPTNYWSIAACFLGGLSFLITLYLLLTKKNFGQKAKAEEE